MRNRFDQQLELLNKQLIHMGELCEVAIGKATTALKEGSMEQAEKVIELQMKRSIRRRQILKDFA